jgi:hypothetical protein
MPDIPTKPPIGDRPPPKKPPIGDRPPPKKPVRADAPMRDPFTDLPTHPAGEGQGANKPEPDRDNHGENTEETIAVEEGFSPIP